MTKYSSSLRTPPRSSRFLAKGGGGGITEAKGSIGTLYRLIIDPDFPMASIGGADFSPIAGNSPHHANHGSQGIRKLKEHKVPALDGVAGIIADQYFVLPILFQQWAQV